MAGFFSEPSYAEKFSVALKNSIFKALICLNTVLKMHFLARCSSGSTDVPLLSSFMTWPSHPTCLWNRIRA